MKHASFCFIALLLGAFSQVRAQADNAAAQKAWMDYMTPGTVHQMIARSDGNWKAEVTNWMAPGAAPMTNTAECTNKMILGGRYQESKFTGTMMGMPF